MTLNEGAADIASAIIISALIIIGGALSFSILEAPTTGNEKLQVVTSFYPLYFFSSQIGGDRAEVLSLMPDNAEPHSWEPRPSDLMRTDTAAVFVYNGAGFEPWVENFIGALSNKEIIIVDTSQGMGAQGSWNGNDATYEGADPHFWLDPISAKVQVSNILTGFIEADPRHAAEYGQNAQALTERLDDLDQMFQMGLANRTKQDIVTTHEGFDYLAHRYGFQAHAAVGISADQQPSAQDLARLTKLVTDLDLNYLFSEPVYSDSIIETLARETGATVLILDGVHGRAGPHTGMDYFQIMDENLKSLRIGLEVEGGAD